MERYKDITGPLAHGLLRFFAVKREALFAAAELTDHQVSEIRTIAAKVNEAATLVDRAIRNYANHKVKRRHLPQNREANTASMDRIDWPSV